ncbi:hypothetical protein N6H14_30930 [Paenibacillus sp. CC-CFT747]|nr:hypothetical protein N6H14_30930 [Paenibacillus sp. CC-CFT747]
MGSVLLPREFEFMDGTEGPSLPDILYPFAVDEIMARRVGEGRRPLIHMWTHPRAMVIGLRDRRLPSAEKAMKDLRKEGYEVAVRNSGGAAVPLDEGVVNLSIILPNPERTMDFRQDFDVMVELIRGSLLGSGASVEAGEIAGAYCPGDYDLSIRGGNFAALPSAGRRKPMSSRRLSWRKAVEREERSG